MWWWLSYADDDGFRGVCIVEGESLLGAAGQARQLGISPGGQVVGAYIPASEMPPESYRNRLLTKADIAEFDPTAMSLAEHEVESS